MDVVEFAAQLRAGANGGSDGVARWAEQFLGTAAQQVLYLGQFVNEMSDTARASYIVVLGQALARLPDGERLLLPAALKEDLLMLLPGPTQALLEGKTRRAAIFQ